jgi:hypothetical protein
MSFNLPPFAYTCITDFAFDVSSSPPSPFLLACLLGCLRPFKTDVWREPQHHPISTELLTVGSQILVLANDFLARTLTSAIMLHSRLRTLAYTYGLPLLSLGQLQLL